MIKKITLVCFLSISAFIITSCGDSEKDNVKEVSKNGSVETVLSVNHINDSIDVVQTSYKVWVKNAIIKNIIHNDTIPSLGVSIEEAENSDGDTKTVPVQKDYEIFITVK